MAFDFEELCLIFSLTEQEQEAFFPEWPKKVWADFGMYELETRSSRMVALCALENAAGKSPHIDAEADALVWEIHALVRAMTEWSGTWTYLIRHPRSVRTEEWTEDDPVCLDRDIYNLWSVLRRLCTLYLQRSPWKPRRRSFDEVFGEVVRNPGWNART